VSGCATEDSRTATLIIDHDCYRNTAVILTGHYSPEFDDYYFRLRKGGYFEYYGKMFNLLRHDRYKGSYVEKNDTLYLSYCRKYTPDGNRMNGKAYIDRKNNKIVLLGKKANYNKDFPIELPSK
jgi:hypothetical protein